MGELVQQTCGSKREELLPLNSRRLTAVFVRQQALALQVPTTGTAEDVRQLLDAKLSVQDANQ